MSESLNGMVSVAKRLRAIVPLALAALVIGVGALGNARAAESAPKGGDVVSAPEAQTCPNGQCFTDVPDENTFAEFVNDLYKAEIISGYACGGAGEPCDGSSRPYYRPSSLVTRAQMTKFVDLARQKPGIVLNATINEGESFAIVATRDAPGQGGFDPGSAIAAANTGEGYSFERPNSAVSAVGGGNSNSVGLYAKGLNDTGAIIDTASPFLFPGAFINGGLLVGLEESPNNATILYGDLTVYGGCAGCRPSEVMLNRGASDLHPGEVVMLNGGAAGPEQIGSMPAVAVEAANTPYSSGAVGVVSSKWVPADPTAHPRSKAASGHGEAADVIKLGEYVVVITQGAYPAMKVDASAGPIRAGDLLVSSGTPGVAMKATDKMEALGAVVGKAMGSLDSGTGTIPVMIMLK